MADVGLLLPMCLAMLGGFAAAMWRKRWAPFVPVAVAVIYLAAASPSGRTSPSGDNPLGYIILDAAIAALVGELAVGVGYLINGTPGSNRGRTGR